MCVCQCMGERGGGYTVVLFPSALILLSRAEGRGGESVNNVFGAAGWRELELDQAQNREGLSGHAAAQEAGGWRRVCVGAQRDGGSRGGTVSATTNLLWGSGECGASARM